MCAGKVATFSLCDRTQITFYPKHHPISSHLIKKILKDYLSWCSSNHLVEKFALLQYQRSLAAVAEGMGGKKVKKRKKRKKTAWRE